MIIGVIADTHIPDRVAELHPVILQTFREAQVSAILHAGDVSIPRVITELETIAPVYAVRGNRDMFYLRNLPMKVDLNLEGVSIGLTHGHGSFVRYTIDRIERTIEGRYAEKYLRRILSAFPQAEVIVFGHLHVPCNFHLQGKLIFNPGTTSYPWPRGSAATFGLLHLEHGKEPWGEILELPI